jgi:hypothetical protein
MNPSRRAFMIAAGASFALPADWRFLSNRSRIFVIDPALRAPMTFDPHARITLLEGDAGWLWHAHLCADVAHAGQAITGLTRPADAFVLTRLASGIGMQTVQHTLDAHAMLWTLMHRNHAVR